MNPAEPTTRKMESMGTLHTLSREHGSSIEVQASKRENAAKASSFRKKHHDPTPISPDIGNATHSAFVPDASEAPNNPDSVSGDDKRQWDCLLGEELPDTECTEFQLASGMKKILNWPQSRAWMSDSFTKFLIDAQIAAQTAERKRERENGRKRIRGMYTGHSKQTKWRNKKAKEQLKAKDNCCEKINGQTLPQGGAGVFSVEAQGAEDSADEWEESENEEDSDGEKQCSRNQRSPQIFFQ
ncbi:hypothetical protein B0H13DRAFT_1924074 [Mycena leptocephala]|nr:hypothetical protein B0H13DRAFT_1924074 [Mycena leptocephala]